MQEEGVDLLALLRDIHEPAAPDWWPPAVGWWVLAALIVLLMGSLFRFCIKRYKAKAACRTAIKSLTAIQTGAQPQSEKLVELNALLKRGALAHNGNGSGEEEAAALHGKNWITFLNNKAGKSRFSEAALNALAFGQYQPPANFASVSAEEIDELFNTSRRWLKNNL